MTNVSTFYTVGAAFGNPKADPPAGIAPFTTQFTANAQWGSGVYDFNWDMGDFIVKTTTYNVANPEHTFNAAGDYAVTLILTDSLGEMWISNPYKVTVYDLPLPFLDLDFVTANPNHTY